MFIKVGVYDVEPACAEKVGQVFATDSITPLKTPDEVEAFVSDQQFPNIKILVANPRTLLKQESLWASIKISFAVPTFHLVLLSSKDVSALIPAGASSERLHIVDVRDEHYGEQFVHHLKGIKVSSDALGLKYNVLDIFVHEEIFADTYDFRTKFNVFIEKLCQSIEARSIQIFLLQSYVTDFFPMYQVGDLTYESIPSSALNASFEFKSKCRTYKVYSAQLCRMAGEQLPDGGPDFAVLSSFTLDTVPCFILYTFDGRQNEDLLWETCNISSWEILHLLYTHIFLSRYKTLTSLAEIQQLNLERNDVLHHILDCLQHHFYADGVSIVEYKGEINGAHKFEKHQKHLKNYDHRVFTTNYGFAHKCVAGNTAFFITETCYDKSAKRGGTAPKNAQQEKSIKDHTGHELSAIGHADGVAYDWKLLDANGGERICIPLYRSEGTVEDEVSLMYYPLSQGGKLIGAIKIADFKNPNVYGLQQLRALSAFSDTVVTLLDSAQALTRLKISKEELPAKLEQLASLLTYRNLIRDIFHQVSQYLSDIGTSLILLEPMIDKKAEATDDDVVDPITDIRNYADLALDLINRAKRRGEDLQPVAKDCELVADVIRPVLQYAKKKADTYKINIVTTLTPRDYPVRLDPEFAQESLKNILNNAIWAIREHRGAGKKEIHIAVRESNNKSVYIEVVDSGIGIDPQIRPEIGKLFFTTRVGGSGVGIYSARWHAEHFGGSLKIEHSMPGKGTTMKIFFPLREGNK